MSIEAKTEVIYYLGMVTLAVAAAIGVVVLVGAVMELRR